MSLSRLEMVGVGLAKQRAGAQPRTILAGINLTFTAGAVTALAGPTGAGKSSLLHLLGGLLRPTEGEILADGESISRFTAAHRDRWRRNVGILFQGAELLLDLSGGENILLPLIPRPGSIRAKAEAVDRILATLDAQRLVDQPARELSGGERQRVALARALVTEPPLLLLDEPSAHQDDGRVFSILEFIGATKDRGAMVVIASHDPRVLESGIADSVHVLEEGRLSAASVAGTGSSR